nr:kinesin-like protein KIN-12E [Coffea arabica]
MEDSAQSITWTGEPETRFAFDHVACEAVDQETLFRIIGVPMVENCLSGYNCWMFAYGQLREDTKKGVYVENLSELSVQTVGDILKLLRQGSLNRKVAGTRTKNYKSRSHTVLTCEIQSMWKKDSSCNLSFARLKLVDLVGSESRQKASSVEVEPLKKTAYLNKSLFTLSRVIKALVDVANGRPRHLPYRDSRLTFLFKEEEDTADKQEEEDIDHYGEVFGPENHVEAGIIEATMTLQEEELSLFQQEDEACNLKEMENRKILVLFRTQVILKDVNNKVATDLQNQETESICERLK